MVTWHARCIILWNDTRWRCIISLNDTRSMVTRWLVDNDQRHVMAFWPLSEAAGQSVIRQYQMMHASQSTGHHCTGVEHVKCQPSDDLTVSQVGVVRVTWPVSTLLVPVISLEQMTYISNLVCRLIVMSTTICVLKFRIMRVHSGSCDRNILGKISANIWKKYKMVTVEG